MSRSRPGFVSALSLADSVTAASAALGFLAAAVASFAPSLAARLVLLAAVADGLDGVLAARLGATPVGEFLDSLADVVSFCVAPALFVLGVVAEGWALPPAEPTARTAVSFAVPALFVVVGVVRLGLYTAYDIGRGSTEGVQTTLAATVLAAGYLAGLSNPVVVLGATAVLAGSMVAPADYPDLRVRDALAMGVVQMGAIAAPTALSRVFPRVLFVCALAYLVGGPWFYPVGRTS